MSLKPLGEKISEGYPYSKFEASVKNDSSSVIAPIGSHPFLVADMPRLKGIKKPYVVITATGREAQEMIDFLEEYDPSFELIEFPSWETLPHERLSPSSETVGKRLRAISRLIELANKPAKHAVFVIMSVRAALQPVHSQLAEHPAMQILSGKEYSLAELPLKLIELGYERVDMVSQRGEFAIRGGIVDVFPVTNDHPVRLEFFGDEIEEMREFSIADQRSLETKLESFMLYPARELLITPEVSSRAREMASEFPNLGEMLEKIANAIPVAGMESLAPVLTNSMVPVFEFIPDNSEHVILSSERIRTRAEDLKKTNEEFLHAAWDAAISGAEAPIDLSAGGFYDWHEFLEKLSKTNHPVRFMAAFGDQQGVDIEVYDLPSFAGIEDDLNSWIEDLKNQAYSIIFTANGPGTAERIAELSGAKLIDEYSGDDGFFVIRGNLQKGLVSPASKLAIITEREYLGRNATYIAPSKRKLASRRGPQVDPLELKAGDYVVHEVHGVGQFKELVQRKVGRGGKLNREYLLIEYAPPKKSYPADTLFVPVDQLDLVTRYVGGEAPVLSKMGGTDWARAKGNARKAVRQIAIDLVKLYAERSKAEGYAFGPDTAWQHELEEAFPYVETSDQLKTIEEVKRDMESPRPMDRLLAGDVGFGKTEVALRAAFKAIQDGKQVAILCPTTLLVRQHMETFRDRFKGFPVNIEALSRFQSSANVKQTLQGLQTGAVDLVIGTHRLLGEGVKFRNLGLIIVDEEQRFGVEHKEKLKSFRANVDVLSMSATPIPRTLEMAVTGIREMSTLATPPEQRQPILTYVGGYSEQQLAAAIRRELIREGQVFYVHNRVSSIDAVANEIARLVPEARVGVAHGKLPEAQLEQVVVDFWDRKFDVLVSTTIIETGIDIPNANTLIVDRAENYGLSQLHQIRGRVGRSRERAYAYFFYDPSKPLTETAHDRLATIATNNELGSGFQVAMKDLEIRGAGNLLGGEQSGHIAGVGFDLYLRMIGEAVDEFKGKKVEAPAELNLEIPVSAHIPTSYLDSDRLRLEAYHKLSAAGGSESTPEQLALILEELEDRYGKAPQELQTLIRVTELRQIANRLGLKDLNMLGDKLRMQPIELTESQLVQLSHNHTGVRYLQSANMLTLDKPVSLSTDEQVIDWVKEFLEGLA
ncbi:MAG: transcription-repair coupling factor [Microbacteriaceae bacterium]|nr:transcription-repair coupling factor [Microbacteriaceae bacterium]